MSDEDLDERWAAQNRLPLPFETSHPGLFAVGDVRSGSTKRVAGAVGEGIRLCRSCAPVPELRALTPPTPRIRWVGGVRFWSKNSIRCVATCSAWVRMPMWPEPATSRYSQPGILGGPAGVALRRVDVVLKSEDQTGHTHLRPARLRAGSGDQASAASYWPSRPRLGHTAISPISDSQVLHNSSSWKSAFGR